jgi:K+:H+ antiporter
MLQATVLADVALVLLAGAALLRFSRVWRQPAVIGEILAGIMLGPSLLGLLPGQLDTRLFPLDARPYLSAIAQIGLLLFMFTLGWELDARRIGAAKQTVAMVTFGSMTLPFALGLGAATLCYKEHEQVGSHHVGFTTFAVYLGITMSITAFPVLARILADSGLAATKVGTLALASAAVGDVLAWCLLAVVVSLAGASGPRGFLTTAGWAAVFILVMAFIVRPLLKLAVLRMSGRAYSTYLAGLVAAGIFLSAYVTSDIGIHPIFGAFAFGVVMPRQPHRKLEAHMLRPFQDASKLLLPVYFIVTGLSVDIKGLRAADYLQLVLLIGVACVGKIVGGTVPARRSGMDWHESFGVGFLMNTRGLTELIILNVGLSLNVLDQRLFTVMVLMALITTAMAGPLLPYLVPAANSGRAAAMSTPPATSHVPAPRLPYRPVPVRAAEHSTDEIVVSVI